MTPAYFYRRVHDACDSMEHTLRQMLLDLSYEAGFYPIGDDTIQDTAARVLGHDTFTATMEMFGSITTWARVMCSAPETIEEYIEEDYTEEEYCDTCEEDYELIYED